MTVDYSAGWSVATWLFYLAVGITAFFALRRAVRTPSAPPHKWLFSACARFLLPHATVGFGIALTLSLSVYLVWNTATQIPGIVAEFDRELSEGVLTLRALTVLVLIRYIAAAWDTTGEPRPALLAFGHLQTSGFKELDELIPIIPPHRLVVPTMVQTVLYMSTIAMLFWCLRSGSDSVARAVVSWGLLTVADDWKVMSDYYYVSGGRLPRPHFHVTTRFNALLIVGSGWTLAQAQVPVLNIIGLLFVQVLLAMTFVLVVNDGYRLADKAGLTSEPLGRNWPSYGSLS